MGEAAPRKIRLLLIEDQALVREGLARLLEREGDMEVVGCCASVREAMGILSCAGVDVVLLDYMLSGEERGSDFLAAARKCGFNGKILVVSGGLSDEEALQLLRQGAVGVFLKEGTPELLAEAIRKVMSGDVWLGQREMKVLLQAETARAGSNAGRSLSDREIGVLRGIFQGLANKEIGARLKVSEATVKAVLQQLFRKNKVNTRGQLVRIAMEKYRKELDSANGPRTGGSPASDRG